MSRLMQPLPGAAGARRGGIFLDKDGTLLENLPYNADPLRMQLAPGADEALRRLGTLDLRLFVVSNQPGVALGCFPASALLAVEARLRDLFVEHGASLTAFFYCPHAPDAAGASVCDCRKPMPGLLLQAAVVHGVDLSASWMIGDILDDVEAGRRAGCKTVLIDNGNETEWRMGPRRQPHCCVADMAAAARIVARAIADASELAA